MTFEQAMLQSNLKRAKLDEPKLEHKKEVKEEATETCGADGL